MTPTKPVSTLKKLKQLTPEVVRTVVGGLGPDNVQ